LNRDTFDNLYCGAGKGVPAASTTIPSRDTMNTYTDQSRVTHPAWLLRDQQQHRPDYPLFDPQEHIAIPFQNNLSTRILEKDYFVPTLPTAATMTHSTDAMRQHTAGSNSGMGMRMP
jgi:hypothetical protein